MYKETIPRIMLKLPKIGLSKKNDDCGEIKCTVLDMVLPRIALSKSPKLIKLNINDPWIYKSGCESCNIKKTSLTPIGTVKKIPTSDNRPPVTPRICNKINTFEEKFNPVLNASIYLDFSDREYDYVSKKMKNINSITASYHNKFVTKLLDIPAIKGNLTIEDFEELLNIYENNQVYYQECMDNKILDIETIKNKLTELEHWFIFIQEPYSDEEGYEDRRKIKKNTGYSPYCDPELYQYITPLSSEKRKLL